MPHSQSSLAFLMHNFENLSREIHSILRSNIIISAEEFQWHILNISKFVILRSKVLQNLGFSLTGDCEGST